MGRGRKSNLKVFESLHECLVNSPTGGTGQPYRVTFGEKAYYIVTTSTSNAIRMTAYHVGFTAKPVPYGEVVTTLKGGSRASS
jgi:hypothetical protein